MSSSIYHFLKACDPLYFGVVVLFAVAYILVAVPGLRHIFEGRPYDLAYSAKIGACMIGGTWFIAAHVFHGGDVVIASWMRSGLFNWAALVVGFGVGLSFHLTGKESLAQTEYADIFYKFCLLPIIVYLCIVTTFPVMAYGASIDKWLLILLYVVYGFWLVLDGTFGLLDQIKYIQEHPLHHRRLGH